MPSNLGLGSMSTCLPWFDKNACGRLLQAVSACDPRGAAPIETPSQDHLSDMRHRFTLRRLVI